MNDSVIVWGIFLLLPFVLGIGIILSPLGWKGYANMLHDLILPMVLFVGVILLMAGVL